MKNRPIVYAIITLLTVSLKAQDTQGFFLDDWSPKSIFSPAYIDSAQQIGATTTRVTINYTDTIARVSKYVYGNNGNPYSGKMNEDTVILKHINNLNPHVIRWPGGNLSQEYFWDRSSKPDDVPSAAGFWGGDSWGQTNNDYYDLLEKTNSTGIICVNIAYARYGTSANPVANAAHHAAEWVRYDNGRTKYWELGNENYGNWEAGYKIDVSLNKDGQPEIISGDLYGQICKVFIDSMRAAAAETGHEIKLGAVSLEEQVTWDPVQQNWNTGMMAHLADLADFYIIHSYYTPYNENSTVETILNSATRTADFVEHVNSGLENAGHYPMPVALTEWNIFANGSQQMVSYINGMHSAITLGEIIKHKIGLSAKWDLSNGWSDGNDHGMFAASDEPEVKFRTPHPQFHYMYYFQKFFGDHMVQADVNGNSNIVAYASSFESGHCGIVLANKSRYKELVDLTLDNFVPGNRYYTYTLTGGTDNGDFSRKVYINGEGTDGVAGGPENYESILPYGFTTSNGIKITMPPLSTVYLLVNSQHTPDILSARVANAPNVIEIKLTRPVVLPDPIEGFHVVKNSMENISIQNYAFDSNDSTILLITLDTPINNTDNVEISYSNGNLYSTDNIPMIEVEKFKVTNLLSGSAPQVIKTETDSIGSEVHIFLNKKMDMASLASFKLNISYMGNTEANIQSIGYYNADSSVYVLKIADPLYYEYGISLSYNGSDAIAYDGGALAHFDSYPVRNYTPHKPATVLHAVTTIYGDSILLHFDKDLLGTMNLASDFTIKTDCEEVAIKSAQRSVADAKTIIIKPRENIRNACMEILISYTGKLLISYDSVLVTPFTDWPVENKSAYVNNRDQKISSFSIYPNPATDQITINSDFSYKSIQIVDIIGKQAYHSECNTGFPASNRISLQLKGGIYYVILSGSGQNSCKKLVLCQP